VKHSNKKVSQQKGANTGGSNCCILTDVLLHTWYGYMKPKIFFRTLWIHEYVV